MKKIHLIALVLIAVGIGYLVMSMGSLSTYETIASAKNKQGKFIHLMAKVDTLQSIDYNPVKGYLSFHIVDSLGYTARAVYNYSLERPLMEITNSDKIAMKGKMNGDVFEIQKDGIQVKCASKYKDDMKRNYEAIQKKS